MTTLHQMTLSELAAGLAAGAGGVVGAQRLGADHLELLHTEIPQLLEDKVGQAGAVALDGLEGLDDRLGSLQPGGADDVAGLGHEHDLKRLDR